MNRGRIRRPCPSIVVQEHNGIAEVVIDHPPVNALDVAGWFALADAVTAAGRVPANRVVVLRAEGAASAPASTSRRSTPRATRRSSGSTAAAPPPSPPSTTARCRSSRPSRASASAAASAWPATPTSSIASEDATFGLPEVDRGALGAATHLARLVPQHAMRKMVYTAKPITAAELASYGSVAAVVPPDRLRAAALELAAEIAAKSPTIIRRAKESLNGIDPVDVKRSYRFEQGFTYELHVRGVADEQRAAFVEKRDADTVSEHLMSASERQAHHRRRHRRRAPLGHDHRHRRLGVAAQAHGRRTRHLPLRPDRPDRRRLRRPRRRPALRHRQG